MPSSPREALQASLLRAVRPCAHTYLQGVRKLSIQLCVGCEKILCILTRLGAPFLAASCLAGEDASRRVALRALVRVGCQKIVYVNMCRMSESSLYSTSLYRDV